MNQSRIPYLDAAKAYLILLVAVGHVLNFINPEFSILYLSAAQTFISTFHMAAFFMIHGMLFRNDKWKKESVKVYVIKRAKSLLIPYLFFEFLGIIWKAIFTQQSVLTGVRNMITVRCNVGADWFLPAMFIGGMLFLIYVKNENRILGVMSALACFLLPMILPAGQIMVVLGRALLAYGFIMTGNLCRSWLQSEKLKQPVVLLGAFAVTTLCAIVNLKFGGNDFYFCTVKNPVTLVLGGIGGMVLVLGVAQLVNGKMLAAIGRSSLTIMGTHQLVIYALSGVLRKSGIGLYPQAIILTMSMIAFEIPVVFLLGRYLPFCVGCIGKDK